MVKMLKLIIGLLLLVKIGNSQTVDSVVLSQSSDVIKYTDKKSRFEIIIKRQQRKPNVVEVIIANVSRNVLGYYTYSMSSNIQIPRNGYWTPMDIHVEPSPEAESSTMELLYGFEQKKYEVDISKCKTNKFDFWICWNVQAFFDSVISRDNNNWSNIDLSKKEYSRLGVPYGGGNMFTSIEMSGISIDTTKYKTVTCIVQE